MNLRKLELKDAPLMLEWMHDESVIERLQTDFLSKTINDCERFISLASEQGKDFHMAIVNDMDEYMGTVSLKNITDDEAEFAITIRKKAMGRGYSKFGMAEIIKMGFEKFNLKSIYWCVNPENERAVRFYDKNNYQRIDSALLKIGEGYTPEQIQGYIWYQVSK